MAFASLLSLAVLSTTEWRSTGRAPADLPVHLRFILSHDTASGGRALEAKFWSVSNPASHDHAQYLDAQGVAELLRPSQRAHDALHAWLGAAGVDARSRSTGTQREHVTARVTARQAEALLASELHVLERNGTSRARVVARHSNFRARKGAGAAPHPMAEHIVEVGVVGEYMRATSYAAGVAAAETSAKVKVAGSCVSAMALVPTQSPFFLWPQQAPYYAKLSVNQSRAVYNEGALVVQWVVACLDPSSAFYRTPQLVPLAQPPAEVPFNASVEALVNFPCGTDDPLLHYEATITNVEPQRAGEAWSARVDALVLAQGGVSVKNFSLAGANGVVYHRPAALASWSFAVGNGGARMRPYERYAVELTQVLHSGKRFARRWAAFVPHANGTNSTRDRLFSFTPLQTPASVRSFYGAPRHPVVCSGSGVSQAIGVPQGRDVGYYSYDDLGIFFDQTLTPVSNAALMKFESSPLLSTDGAAALASHGIAGPMPVLNNGGEPGGETTLDVQWSAGMAPGAQSRAYHSGMFSNANADPAGLIIPHGSFVGLFSAMVYAAAPGPPLAVSISYSGPEHLQRANRPLGYGVATFDLVVTYLHEIWQMLGVRGTSVFFSSGDQGAHYVVTGGEAGVGNGGGGGLGGLLDPFVNCANFSAMWPADSPFVTSVGASQLLADLSAGALSSGGAVPIKEVASDIAQGARITGGGGFAEEFALPAYQVQAVSAYFANTSIAKPPSLTRNPLKRGYPDVVLVGNNLQLVFAKTTYQVAGTSAATPAMMGLVTLMNGKLLAAGRPSLGFLNPKLYALHDSNPEAFRDVTEGSNNCMGQSIFDSVCCDSGYTAGTGWDPVSGLGSIRFEKIEPLLQAMMPAAQGWKKRPPTCATVAASACQQTCGPGYAGPFVTSGTCDAAGTCRAAAPAAPAPAPASQAYGVGIGIGITLSLGVAAAASVAWRARASRSSVTANAQAFPTQASIEMQDGIEPSPTVDRDTNAM